MERKVRTARHLAPSKPRVKGLLRAGSVAHPTPRAWRMRGAAGGKGIIISVGGARSGVCACCKEGDIAVKADIHVVDSVKGYRWTLQDIDPGTRPKGPCARPSPVWMAAAGPVGRIARLSAGPPNLVERGRMMHGTVDWIKVISFATPDGWHLNGLPSRTLDLTCLAPRVPEQGSGF